MLLGYFVDPSVDDNSSKTNMAATMVETPPPQLITTIEWSMMDKSKFFPLSMLSSFTVRCALYPLTLVKTQIQVQRKKEAYSGVLDAISKIYRHEGVSGLYRGFWLSSIVSGVFYISTYEGVRHELGKHDVDPKIKSFVGGGCASIVGQTIIVPFDVLSQHLMVLGLVRGRAGGSKNPTINPLGLNLDKGVSRSSLAKEVAYKVYQLHGPLGYYRGYAASLAAYVPNSALWWALYTTYQDELLKISPEWVSHLFIQCVAGTFGGFTTTLLTNPLDIVRARLQVEGVGTMKQVFRDLWLEEGLSGLYLKGLSARLVQSACFSFSIILGYETIKRVSLNEEYRPRVWMFFFVLNELLKISPEWVSHLFIQCVAGTFGGFTTTLLTNPLDIVRARLQVEGVGTMKQVFRDLWLEEGLSGLYLKGLSARLVQSACFSFSIILGYETIKRVSLNEEYRPRVRW